MELLLVRHALPLRVEVTEGHANPDLSTLGHQQAAAVATWLVDERPDGLYSSPLARARQTAAAIAESCDLEMVIDDDLAEWDRESTAYIPTEELKAANHEVWRALTEGRWDDLGIDVEAFGERVSRAFARIALRHQGAKIVVVCHGGVINSYVGTVLGIDRLLFFEPAYTAVSRVLVSREGALSVRSINETAHLRHVLD